ncbi:MAG: hypothetical protein VKI63_08360 [Cyanobium sp.]|nr:hypothetical protein [Cyanobium sp.]
MTCHRCGGRMLSRAGSSRLGLVCSDCGTPTPLRVERGRPHPLVTGLTMVSMAAFALLLFFLTNWRPLPAQQAASQRAMIKQLTTGEFVREPELTEKSAHSEE